MRTLPGQDPHLSVGEENTRMGKKIHCRGSLGKVNWVMMGTSDWNTDSGKQKGAESLAVKYGRSGRSQMGFSLGKCPSAPRRAPAQSKSVRAQPQPSTCEPMPTSGESPKGCVPPRDKASPYLLPPHSGLGRSQGSCVY